MTSFEVSESVGIAVTTAHGILFQMVRQKHEVKDYVLLEVNAAPVRRPPDVDLVFRMIRVVFKYGDNALAKEMAKVDMLVYVREVSQTRWVARTATIDYGDLQFTWANGRLRKV